MNTSVWPKSCYSNNHHPDIYILPNFGFLMVPKTVKFTSRNGIKTHPEMGKDRGEKIHPILVALVQRSISALLYNTYWALSREWHESETHQYLLPRVQAALLPRAIELWVRGQHLQRNYS